MRRSRPPGHRTAEHVDAEVDVLVVVLGGHGAVLVDGELRDLAEGCALPIPQGASRAITTGDGGLRYRSVHRRRRRLASFRSRF